MPKKCLRLRSTVGIETVDDPETTSEQIVSALLAGQTLTVQTEDGTLNDGHTGAAEIHSWNIKLATSGSIYGTLDWSNVDHGARDQTDSFSWQVGEFRMLLKQALLMAKRNDKSRRRFSWQLHG